MSKAKPLIFGAALGASAMFFAQQYHVVHSHDGLQVIPRTPQQSLGLAYADIRNWGPSQWTDRPELARALMAHGSTDLISESVATTLADRVSEDTSTLDELREFLNSTKTDATAADDGAPGLPLSNPDKWNIRSGSGPDPGSDDDLFRIPLPQDTRTRPLVDPFEREARIEEKTSALKSDSGSRFSADDFPGGLQAADFSEALPQSRTTAPAVSNPSGLSIAEQAKKMEERLFGTSVAPSSGSIQKQAGKAAVRSTESESMFEEVATQLENRAQEALNRARASAGTKAAATIEDSSRASAGYIRERATEMLPDAARSLLNGDGLNTEPLMTPDKFEFDPFLE